MRHPNIVELLAYSIGKEEDSKSPICMVMEKMDRSLYDCIYSGVELDVFTKMKLLIGVAKVSYLRYDDSRGNISRVFGVSQTLSLESSSGIEFRLLSRLCDKLCSFKSKIS